MLPITVLVASFQVFWVRHFREMLYADLILPIILKTQMSKSFLKIIVQLQLSPFPPITLPCPTQPHLAHSILPSVCLCLWVLYTCSFMTLPLLSPLSLSTFPSGNCHFVCYSHVSGYILLTCLFC